MRRRCALGALLLSLSPAFLGPAPRAPRSGAGAGAGRLEAAAPAKPRIAQEICLNQTLWKPYALRLLKNAKFFQDLSPEQRREAANLMMLQELAPGATLFRQGEAGDKFFIVADGEVEAYVASEEGEELVKVYRAGEYFGELALLTRAPRRASLRGSEEAALLLWLSRKDFERTFGPLRELLLRSAAFRPASRAVRQGQKLAEASFWEQVLGLTGGQRRLLAAVALYLVIGTAYYSYTGFQELPGASSVWVAFYFSVETALAVGFGVLTPRGAESPFFTAGFVICGAALLVNFLSGLVADFLEESAARTEDSDGPRLGGGMLGPAGPLLLWWLLGVAFGVVHEGWDWGTAALFAISATSSVGIQGLDSKDDVSLLFCAVYLLVGVPLYASVIARISLRVADDILKRRQQEIKRRTMASLDGCDDECKLDVFSMYDADQDGRITKQELPELLRFLCVARGVEITDADIDFLLKEWDEDKTETISQAEFLAGLEKWQAKL
ncbi:unnamed protein product [Effrenium voratum]|nr:unnamed protein product [Effrenium voratum]